MLEQADDRTEVLYLALTRPALKWGVPVEGLTLNVLIIFIGGMLLSMNPSGGLLHSLLRSPFMFWSAFFPIHYVMRSVTAVDYHGFRMLRLWLETTVATGPVLQNLPTIVRSGRECASSV